MRAKEDEPSSERLLTAFEELRGCVSSVAPQETKGSQPMADVFIAVDEAHSLFGVDGSGLFEFQRALMTFSRASLFTFFLSTTGKISQSLCPCGSYEPPHTFIELGFDQLMWNRKVLDKYRTLEEVTSSECVSHMGRPL
jgi:hypothetical protein